MGLMRRRPLLRSAATAAGSYYMGKKRAEREQMGAQAQGAPAAAAPAQGSNGAPNTLDQLEKLGSLHSQGVLTDDEFAQQKAKLLGT
jgi:Short C-terminal domain